MGSGWRGQYRVQEDEGGLNGRRASSSTSPWQRFREVRGGPFTVGPRVWVLQPYLSEGIRTGLKDWTGEKTIRLVTGLRSLQHDSICPKLSTAQPTSYTSDPASLFSHHTLRSQKRHTQRQAHRHNAPMIPLRSPNQLLRHNPIRHRHETAA